MFARIVLIGTLSGLLLACAEKQATEPATFQPVTDVHHTMELILDPAADVIWSSAGTIITADGRQELAPTTDEGWHVVEQNAAVIAESGNLLMMPSRSGGPDWDEYSRGLIDAGKLAMDAAVAQDADALFDAGGRIYQVCLACHNQYWVQIDETDEE